jgi:hypothetical protein
MQPWPEVERRLARRLARRGVAHPHVAATLVVDRAAADESLEARAARWGVEADWLRAAEAGEVDLVEVVARLGHLHLLAVARLLRRIRQVAEWLLAPDDEA